MHGTIYVLSENGYKPDMETVMEHASYYFLPAFDSVDEFDDKGFKLKEMRRYLDCLKTLGTVQGDTEKNNILLTFDSLSDRFLKNFQMTGDKVVDYLKCLTFMDSKKYDYDPVVICTGYDINCGFSLYDAIISTYHSREMWDEEGIANRTYSLSLVDCLDFHR